MRLVWAHSSETHWHGQFAATLRDMVYSPCTADPGVWQKYHHLEELDLPPEADEAGVQKNNHRLVHYSDWSH